MLSELKSAFSGNEIEIWALVFAAVSCLAALSTIYVSGSRLNKLKQDLEKVKNKLHRI